MTCGCRDVYPAAERHKGQGRGAGAQDFRRRKHGHPHPLQPIVRPRLAEVKLLIGSEQAGTICTARLVHPLPFTVR